MEELNPKYEWYGAALLSLSSFVGVVALRRLSKDGHFLPFGVVLLSMVSSFFYHLCDSQMFCFGPPDGDGEVVFSVMDFYFAYYSIAVVLLSVLFLKPHHPVWADAIDILFSGVILLLVLWDRHSLYPLLPSGFLLVCVVLRMIRFHSSYRKNVLWRFLLLGVLITLCGEVANYLGNNSLGDYYWLLHSCWHIGIYLSVYFIYRSLSHAKDDNEISSSSSSLSSSLQEFDNEVKEEQENLEQGLLLEGYPGSQFSTQFSDFSVQHQQQMYPLPLEQQGYPYAFPYGNYFYHNPASQVVPLQFQPSSSS